MKRAHLALAASLALTLVSSTASAQVCGRGRSWVPRAVPLTLGPADFGLTPTPCGVAYVGADVRAQALIDEPDFYGALGAELVVNGQYPVHRRVWISAAVTALRFRYAQNATLVASDLGLGASDVGVHVGILSGEKFWLSAYGRVLLPTAMNPQYAAVTGFEPGVSALWMAHPRVALLGGLSVPITTTWIGSRAQVQVEVRAAVDVSVRVASWFDPTVGVEVRFANAPWGPFELFAPRLSLRFLPGRGVSLHLSAIAPIAGEERTDIRFSLGGGYTW